MSHPEDNESTQAQDKRVPEDHFGLVRVPTVRPDEEKQVLQILDRYIQEHEIKRLVDAIARRRAELGFRIVSILSLHEGEGRTFLTAVLARAFMRFLSARVLVVDATGRVGGSKLLSALRSTGEGGGARSDKESCVVATLGDLEDVTHRQYEFQCGELLRSVEDDFDIIFVDTQSLSTKGAEGYDASLVARQMDATIALVSESSSAVNDLSAMKQYLSNIDAPCIGVVTNVRSLNR